MRRPLRGFPALLDWSGLLINSHDPLRGHVLKHIRRTTPDQPALLGGAQGKEGQNLKLPRGHFVPTLLAYVGVDYFTKTKDVLTRRKRESSTKETWQRIETAFFPFVSVIKK